MPSACWQDCHCCLANGTRRVPATIMNTLGFQLLIVAITFVVSGMVAHFVAENRGRPVWEPWLLAGVTALLAAGCLLVMPTILFAVALAPLPPAAMFFFRRVRRTEDPLTCPCPHCRDEFIVDARFGGKPVTCPHCKQLFLGPRVTGVGP